MSILCKNKSIGSPVGIDWVERENLFQAFCFEKTDRSILDPIDWFLLEFVFQVSKLNFKFDFTEEVVCKFI